MFSINAKQEKREEPLAFVDVESKLKVQGIFSFGMPQEYFHQ